MLDFGSARFQRSFGETVAWCRMRSLAADDADSDGIRRRHAPYLQSEQLLQEARASANQGGLRRKITDTGQWQHAMALLKQIRDSLVPAGRRLRSDELRPSFSLDQCGTDALWAEVTAGVVARRTQLTANTFRARDCEKAVGGRLLLYNPSENLACGGAEASTKGFFDVNNVPPWDIWVDFSDGTLASWVPPALVELAQMGIDANPESCIRWAANSGG